MSLKLPDSGAEVTPDGRRHAKSSARNAAPILEVLQRELPHADGCWRSPRARVSMPRPLPPPCPASTGSPAT